MKQKSLKSFDNSLRGSFNTKNKSREKKNSIARSAHRQYDRSSVSSMVQLSETGSFILNEKAQVRLPAGLSKFSQP